MSHRQKVDRRLEITRLECSGAHGCGRMTQSVLSFMGNVVEMGLKIEELSGTVLVAHGVQKTFQGTHCAREC